MNGNGLNDHPSWTYGSEFSPIFKVHCVFFIYYHKSSCKKQDAFGHIFKGYSKITLDQMEGCDYRYENNF